MLVARPNATVLYKTLGWAEAWPEEKDVSTRHLCAELNRLGVTGVIDAGGGSQSIPTTTSGRGRCIAARDDASHRLQPVHTEPRRRTEDFRRWNGMTRPGAGDSFYRMNGAGEMPHYSAATLRLSRAAS